MDNIQISPEYSTQPKKQKINPMLPKVLRYLTDTLDNLGELVIADQGCGALRHLETLLGVFSNIVLVDTKLQLSRHLTLDEQKITIPEYINSLGPVGNNISVLNASAFSESKLNLNVIFNLCTFDVVLPEIREEMINSVKNNLIQTGYFVLIIPRNDSSIVNRCNDSNEISDGHYFQRSSILTFYTNYKSYNNLLDTFTSYGFTLEKDLSVYRHICLVFKLGG